jgi:hypothetical protein
MVDRERRVKRLDAESGGVFGESPRRHDGDRSESADVAVVQGASIVEDELERGIPPLLRRKLAGVDQQRAGKAGLHDESVARGEIEHNKLCAAPRARDGRARHSANELSSRSLAQDIGFGDPRACDRATAQRRVEVAGDRLGLRKFGHGD